MSLFTLGNIMTVYLIHVHAYTVCLSVYASETCIYSLIVTLTECKHKGGVIISKIINTIRCPFWFWSHETCYVLVWVIFYSKIKRSE